MCSYDRFEPQMFFYTIEELVLRKSVGLGGRYELIRTVGCQFINQLRVSINESLFGVRHTFPFYGTP